LNYFSLGILSITRNKRIVWSNTAANRILYSDGPITAIDGFLILASLAHRAALESAIEATMQAAPPFRRAFAIARPGSNPVSVLVGPAHEAGASRRSSNRVLLFISDPGLEPDLNREVLSALFGFTPAECSVALLIGAGKTPKAAASELGVSIFTVRNHLKSLFAKTSTRDQCQLIRLLVRSPASLSTQHLIPAELRS
jgi:DNA-binding CsgD family transcriptional regulator